VFRSDVRDGANGDFEDDDLTQEFLADHRWKALADSAEARSASERKAIWRKRSRAIRVYALKRAGEKCEGCGASPPFEHRRASRIGNHRPKHSICSLRAKVDSWIVTSIHFASISATAKSVTTGTGGDPRCG
jgi:hypothetical protein